MLNPTWFKRLSVYTSYSKASAVLREGLLPPKDASESKGFLSFLALIGLQERRAHNQQGTGKAVAKGLRLLPGAEDEVGNGTYSSAFQLSPSAPIAAQAAGGHGSS